MRIMCKINYLKDQLCQPEVFKFIHSACFYYENLAIWLDY